MELSRPDAYQLVKSALESGAISLGNPSLGETATKAGEQAAEYLIALLDGLVKKKP